MQPGTLRVPDAAERGASVEAFPRGAWERSQEQASLHRALVKIMGVDLTPIPTIGIESALVLASEVGPDLSRFPSFLAANSISSALATRRKLALTCKF